MGLAICRYLCRNIYGDQYRQQIDLSQAPKDILRVIFDKLDLQTLGKISLCSKTFNAVAGESRFWERIVEEAGLVPAKNIDKKTALKHVEVLKYLYHKCRFAKVTSVLDLPCYSKKYVVLSGDGFDLDPKIPTLNLKWGRYGKVLSFDGRKNFTSYNSYTIEMIALQAETESKLFLFNKYYLDNCELFIRHVTADEEKIINDNLKAKTIKFC
jgi:hypothetical protein